MEDQRSPDPAANSPVQGSSSSEKNEPVRSRWTPKPEQILILESIFNSGMVNPPKDETVKIRKLLEKFGSVGDANVFYWFQNRRSRSRRRQRQIQASLAGGDHHHQQLNNTSCSSSSTQALAQALSSGFATSSSSSSDIVGGSSSSSSCNININIGDGGGILHDNFFSTSSHHQMGLLDDIDHNSSVNSILYPSNLHFQSGFITVLINGVPTEVPRGPLDMKAMFGEDLVLIHSSGLPVPFNDYAFNSLQSLQHGESYFLVSRST